MQADKTSLLRNQSRAFHDAGYNSKPRDANDILRTNGASALRRTLDGAAPITLPTASTRKPEEILPDEAWKNPDWTLLEDRRGELPEFPIDVLDPASRNFIKRASHGAGVTHAHVAVPLLSVVSGQIGTARRVAAAKSWSEPASLWTSVVGSSGTGKTPGLDVAKRHLAEVERSRRETIAGLQRDHETRMESARAATKKWKKEVEEAIEAGRTAPLRPANAIELRDFIAPRLSVSNATVERLAVLLQARPYGLMIIADELAGLFLNMGRYSKGSDQEFWLEAWKGKHYIVERMGRPPVAIDHLLIGIAGGLQPDKLVRSFQGDDDGMYARILFAWPPEPQYRALTNEIDEIEDGFVKALARIVDLAPITTTEQKPDRLTLSSDAAELFETFRQFLHRRKQALDGREREWWAKGGSQVLRLSLTLTFLAWSWLPPSEGQPRQIEEDALTAAIRLWRDYFWPHAKAALRQIGLSEKHAHSRRVLRWIRSSREPGDLLSLKDIRRDALSQYIDAEQTERLLEELERAGWLKKQTTPTGGRPNHRWAVNELLWNAQSAETAERGEDYLDVQDDECLSALSALPASGGGQ
jgi:Protein of unknown function (DUF3987)